MKFTIRSNERRRTMSKRKMIFFFSLLFVPYVRSARASYRWRTMMNDDVIAFKFYKHSQLPQPVDIKCFFSFFLSFLFECVCVCACHQHHTATIDTSRKSNVHSETMKPKIVFVCRINLFLIWQRLNVSTVLSQVKVIRNFLAWSHASKAKHRKEN